MPVYKMDKKTMKPKNVDNGKKKWSAFRLGSRKMS